MLLAVGISSCGFTWEVWRALKNGSTKTRNPESGNGNGNGNGNGYGYGICERRFQAIDLKKNILAMTIK